MAVPPSTLPLGQFQAPTPEVFDALTDDQKRLVLRLDLSRRFQAGESPRIESYLERYPSLRKNQSLLMDLLISELTFRAQQGEKILQEEPGQRFPDLKDCITQWMSLGALGDYPTLVSSDTSWVESPGLRRIAGYELEAEIGRGAMGVVYRAQQVGLNRSVALKMILNADDAGTAEQLRFHREAQAIARLDHPNIVRIYEIGEHDGKPFFSLELITSGCLADRLRGKAMPSQSAAKLLLDMAQGIHAAHRAQVLHRDLKPANVLMTESGSPKITDFGLAKQLDQVGQTQTGAIVGTPAYMAPEQARGLSGLDATVDIYALGAILYECLTGVPPFRAPTVFEVLQQAIQETPVPPGKREPSVPRDLETICLKCLEKDSRKRYGSADLLAEDLRRYLQGEPIQARPVGPVERAWRWIARNPVVSALLLAVVLSLSVGTVVSTVLAFRADTKATEATKAKKLAGDRAEAEKAAKAEAIAKADAERRERKRGDSLQYAGQIRLAYRLWQQGRVRAATEALQATQWDLRRWDHGYIHSLLNRAVTLDRHMVAIEARIHPDGHQIASVHHRNKLSIWSAVTGKVELTFVPTNQSIRALAYHPNGSTIAVADSSGQLALWSSVTGLKDRELAPGGNRIHAIAFQPLGKQLVAAHDNGQLTLWDVKTGKLIRVMQGHSQAARSVHFHPDGDRIVSGSQDFTVKVWQASTGKLIFQLPRSTGAVHAVRFSPGGKLLATAGLDQPIDLWDSTTGEHIRTMKGGHTDVMATAFTPDSQWLFTGDRTGIKLWDIDTGLNVDTFVGHGGTVRSLDLDPQGRRLISVGNRHLRLWAPFSKRNKVLAEQVECAKISPDGRYLVSGGRDARIQIQDIRGEPRLVQQWRAAGSVTELMISHDGRTLVTTTVNREIAVWEMPTGKPVQIWKGHEHSIRCAALSPNGKLIATGDEKGTIVVWEINGQKKLEQQAHKDEVLSLQFSDDGRQIISAGKDQVLKVLDATTGETVQQSVRLQGTLSDMQITSEHHRFLTVDNNLIRMWDLDTGEELLRLRGGLTKTLSATFSPNGHRILSVELNGSLRVWSTTTGQNSLTIDLGPSSLQKARFSPDGATVIAIYSSGNLQILDANAGQAAMEIRADQDVACVCHSPDGNRAAIADARGTVAIHSMVSGRRLISWKAHGDRITSVHFSPDGQRIVTGSLDHTAKVWSTETGQLQQTFSRHSSYVHQVRFSPGGNLVASSSDDGTIRLWHPDSGKEEKQLHGPKGDVISLEFHPSKPWLLVGGHDPVIHLWDHITGKVVRKFSGHRSGVICVRFCPDRPEIVSCSYDNTARAWDIETATEKHQIRFQNSLTVLPDCFSPDRSLLVRQSAKETIGLYDFRTGKLKRNWGVASRFPSCAQFSPSGDAVLIGSVDQWVHRRLLKPQEKLAIPTVQSRLAQSLPSAAWHEQQANQAATRINRFAEAFHLRHCLQAEPWRVDLRVRLFYALTMLGRYQQAALQYGWSVLQAPRAALWPADPLAKARGMAAGKQGQWDKAEDAFFLTAHKSGSYHFDWYYLAITQLAQGKFSDYRQSCEQMIQRYKGARHSRLHAACIYFCTMGECSKAQAAELVQMARLLYKAERSLATALRLGMALYRLGELQESIIRFREALAIQKTGGPVLHLFFALALHRVGKVAESSQHFQKALAAHERLRNPSWDYVAQWNSRLKEATKVLAAPAPMPHVGR